MACSGSASTRRPSGCMPSEWVGRVFMQCGASRHCKVVHLPSLPSITCVPHSASPPASLPPAGTCSCAPQTCGRGPTAPKTALRCGIGAWAGLVGASREQAHAHGRPRQLALQLTAGMLLASLPLCAGGADRGGAAALQHGADGGVAQPPAAPPQAVCQVGRRRGAGWRVQAGLQVLSAGVQPTCCSCQATD